MTKSSTHMMQRIVLTVLGCLVLLFWVAALGEAAQVTLQWDPNTPTPDGYNLFKRIEGGAYDYSKPVNTELIKGTTFTVHDLTPGKHYFVVRAVVGSNVSGDSNEESFIVRETVSCFNLLDESGAQVDDIQPGAYYIDGFPYIVHILEPPEENDEPPFSTNSPRTIYHRSSCRYFNIERGIYDPADCPTCRPCKICGGE